MKVRKRYGIIILLVFWLSDGGISRAQELVKDASAPAMAKEFSVALKDYRLNFRVGAAGELYCDYQSNGISQAIPIGGQVFSGVRMGGSLGNCQWRYHSHTMVREVSGQEHTTIVLKNAEKSVDVELHLRAYAQENILERWTSVHNRSNTGIEIAQLDAFDLQVKSDRDLWLESYDSTSGAEAGKPIRQRIDKGRKELTSNHGNRHVSGTQPFFILGIGQVPDEEVGACLVSSLVWTGSTRFTFELGDAGVLEVAGGVNQSQSVIIPSEQSIASPSWVSTYSHSGKGPASRDFHRWVRRYGMRDGERLRLIDNNSWEGCKMEVSESAIIEMMQMSSELGIELYVMDDGWFGNGENARVTDHAGLGDWQVNRQRFPRGLEPILDACAAKGVAFGLWFEPEMVNPKSLLYQEHPEWVMKVPGKDLQFERNQVVLDMANPEVQEYVYKAVADVLTAHPRIRFVKWDANSSLRNPYSPYLGEARQGEMLYRYFEGYDRVMERLVRQFPHVDFQACAGGGGRADLGTMKHGHTFWPSDNTNPAYRLGGVWNFSLILPMNAPTSHVTHAGKYQTKYRFDVSMMSQLGMEVDPRKSSVDYLAAAKVGIAAYKSVRETVQLGDQYRHRHPFDSTTPSVNYVSRTRQQALLLAYQTQEIHEPLVVHSGISGLDPDLVYRVREINLPPGDERPRLDPTEKTEKTGAEWMKDGVKIVFARKYDSAALVFDQK